MVNAQLICAFVFRIYYANAVFLIMCIMYFAVYEQCTQVDPVHAVRQMERGSE